MGQEMHFSCKINKSIYFYSILLISFFSISMQISAKEENQLIEEDAKVLISEMMVELKSLLIIGQKNPSKGRQLLSDLLDEYFDSKLIAKYSTMPSWRKANKKERAEFILLFKEYLIDLAANRFNEFENISYDINLSQKRGEKMVLVDGLIRAPGNKRDKTPLGWRLTLNNQNQLKIIDVEIAKISMVIAQNEEFTSIIRKNKGKFSALIYILEKELEKN